MVLVTDSHKIINAPTGELVNKEMDLAAFRSGNMAIETLEAIERKVQMFEDTALVSTVVYLKASFMGSSIDGKARFFRTWKKSDGKWEVIGGASVNMK